MNAPELFPQPHKGGPNGLPKSANATLKRHYPGQTQYRAFIVCSRLLCAACMPYMQTATSIRTCDAAFRLSPTCEQMLHVLLHILSEWLLSTRLAYHNLC